MNFKIFVSVFAGLLALAVQASEPSFNNRRPTNPLWQLTWKDKLKQDLLLHYDKFTRPAFEKNKTIVNVDMTLRRIELDEKRFVMKVHCWMKLDWNDEKLRWNSTNYNGVHEIHLAEHEIWQPDLFPYNSASGNSLNYFGNTNLIAYSNGKVLWVPPTVFEVFCPMDFSKWPFDSQTCSLKIGSWVYNGEQIDLINMNDRKVIYEVPEFSPSPQWDFVKMTIEKNSVHYPCCSVPYSDITFNFTIQRNSATYKALIVTPTSAIIITILSSFLIPPTSGDKMFLTGMATVVNCMILIFFMYQMPSMASQTPNIVSFYSTSMCLVSLAVFLSVIVYNLANPMKHASVPWLLKRNLSGWLGKLLFLPVSNNEKKSTKAEEMTDRQPVLSDQARPKASTNEQVYQEDWILLATALNRVLFLLYSLAFIIMSLLYSA